MNEEDYKVLTYGAAQIEAEFINKPYEERLEITRSMLDEEWLWKRHLKELEEE